MQLRDKSMTIKDLATKTGYGVATVSRVLNGQPNVSEKARKIILEAAKECNFQINPNAQQLKQQHSTTIAVVVKGTYNQLFGELVENIQNLIAQTEYTLYVDYMDEDGNEVLEALRLCREKKPLGMLFLGTKALSIVMILALILAAAAAALILHKTETEMINLLLKKDRPVKTAKTTQTVQAVQPAAETKPQQNLEQAYLKALQKRMSDAEHSYKELLLQVMTMEDDLNQDNLEQLRARLSTMRNQLAPEVNPTGNTSIDPIMTYYTRQALLSNVKIATNLSLPDISSVTDEEMTVLMGCLMDCALDACREMTTGTRRIATASYLDDGLLQIGVKHTYASAVDSNCEQLKICRKIVSRYDGKLTVLDMGGVAQIVAVLHI